MDQKETNQLIFKILMNLERTTKMETQISEFQWFQQGPNISETEIRNHASAQYLDTIANRGWKSIVGSKGISSGATQTVADRKYVWGLFQRGDAKW
jgi:hypothetical protein